MTASFKNDLFFKVSHVILHYVQNTQMMLKRAFKKIYLFSFMCMSVCLHVCVFTTCGMCGAQGGQKRAWDLLELKVQMGVKCQGGAGNQSQVLRENSEFS